MKLTNQTTLVLRALLESLGLPQYGYDLMKQVALPSGTLYPILSRFEAEGLVTSAWSTPSGDAGDDRPRRYYVLTAEGERLARAAASQIECKPTPRPSGEADLVPAALRVAGAAL